MKKLRLYLDTSIINFAIDNRDLEKNEITKKLLGEIRQGKYTAFISSVVITEIERCDNKEKRENLLKIIKDFSPEELIIDEEVQRLAKRYVEEGIIPVKYLDDARHIAVASVNDLDVVVSWNLEHIVKMKTEKEVGRINVFMRYRAIDIYSPQEIVENV